MSIDEMIREIDELPNSDLERLRGAIERRLGSTSATSNEEREYLRRLSAAGLVTAPFDRSRATPIDQLPKPIEIAGARASERIIAERR